MIYNVGRADQMEKLGQDRQPGQERRGFGEAGQGQAGGSRRGVRRVFTV